MAAVPADDFAFRVTGLGKAFRLPEERVHTLKERMLHPARGRRMQRLAALDDVSFEVRRGEFFGIVGRNGSGKSTLMKCLAGVYRPDAGEIWATGRTAPFIELGVGFNPELTARDNVLINAVMLGLPVETARERYASIIAFAELEAFQDLALKNYSSGMQVRLAFAVMVHVEADVLLIDEVLAVGDAAFQQKCHDALSDARARGRTILLVTHDMDQIQRFCDRAMLLERGRVDTIGDPSAVARRYMQTNFAQGPVQRIAQMPAEHAGDAGDLSAVIVDAWCQDGEGLRADSHQQGESCALVMRARFTRDVDEPVFTFILTDDQRRRVLAMTSEWDENATGSYREAELVDVAASFDNWLAPGRYFVTARVEYPGGTGRAMAHREELTSLIVTGSRSGGGVVDIPHKFFVFPADRSNPAASA